MARRVRAFAAVALLALAPCTRTRGQGVETLLDEISRLEQAAAAENAGAAERATAAGQAFSRREELIRIGASDPRLAAWMTDQAAAILDFPRDRASAVLLGIPAQPGFPPFLVEDQALGSVDDALGLLQRAEAEAGAAIASLDQRQDLTDAEAQTLARLVGPEANVRRPFLEGRAALLKGAILRRRGDAAEAARLTREAARLLEGVHLDPGPAEGARLVNLAIASLLLGEIDAAMGHLSAVASLSGPTDLGLAPETLHERLLATVHLRVRSAPGERAALDAAGPGGPPAQWRAREQSGTPAAAACALVDAAGARLDHELVAAACRVLLATGVPPDASSPVNHNLFRIASLLSEPRLKWVDPRRLPPEAVLAYATLGRPETGAPPSMDLLVDLLARQDAAGTHAAAAKAIASGVGAAPARSGDFRALRAALDFAARSPGSGPEIAAPALPGLRAAARSSEPPAGAAGLYTEALALATGPDSAIEAVNAWRLERARVALEAARDSGSPPLAMFDALELIPRAAPESADASPLYTITAANILSKGWSALAAARRAGNAAEFQRLATSQLNLAQRAVTWCRERAPSRAAEFELDLADAQTELGRADGLETFASLLPRLPDLPVDPVRPRLGLGRAQLLAGRTAEGFATLRDLAASLDAPPADPSAPARREEFWHAWALMLEVLGAQNADGSRSGAIAAHAERLRTIDPSLGGPPWNGRIEAAAGAR